MTDQQKQTYARLVAHKIKALLNDYKRLHKCLILFILLQSNV